MYDETLPPPEEFFDDGAPRSAKASNRKARKASKEARQLRRTPKPIEARNPKQQAYIDSLTENELTFGIGPAGVGKTYVPARVYGAMLVTGEIEKIYVARPNVSKAQHKNGFLPGGIKEKTEPWLIPIFEGLRDALGKKAFEEAQKQGVIEEVPFEFIQGRTFQNAACIVDEAENLDHDDLYITLTRQGDDLRMVLCGDIYQARIRNSGLADVIEMAHEDEHEGCGVIVFTEDEVVRSRQAAQWVKSFRKRPHLMGFHTVKGHQNLHNVTECDKKASETFQSNPPDFLKGET